MTQTVRGDTDPAASEPFRQWQYAAAALKAAEARGASHAEIVQLSAAVIRTRNALTLDRVYAGWEAPDDIVKHLTADEQLLHENDDTARA